MINQSSVTYSGQLESAGANPIQKGRQMALSIFKNLLTFGLFAFLLLGVQGTLAAQEVAWGDNTALNPTAKPLSFYSNSTTHGASFVNGVKIEEHNIGKTPLIEASAFFRDDVFCWRETYGRGVGTVPAICPNGMENQAGLCYTLCKEGYHGVGPICWANCPEGFRDDGAFCFKPEPYTRGGGYIWKIGDKAFSAEGQFKRCEDKHGKGNCEQYGAIVYPKCKEGYYAAGCCVCSPICPEGWTDIGVSCTKPSYGRGVGLVPTICPDGKENNAGLCYNLCKEGFTGVGPVCWEFNCPNVNGKQWVDCGAGCAESVNTCATSVIDMVSSPLLAVLSIAGMVVTGGASGAATTGALGGAAAASAGAKAINVTTKAGKVITYTSKAVSGAASISKQAIENDLIAKAQELLNGKPMPEHQRKGIEEYAAMAYDASRSTTFDWRDLAAIDPTGLASVAAAYANPLCRDIKSSNPSSPSSAQTYAYIQAEDGLHNKALIGGDTYNESIYHQDANKRDNAKWKFKPAGDGYYYIIDVKHNKALVAGDNANNRVYHQEPNDRDNAKWKLEPVGDGTFHITDKKHGKSLVAGTSYDGNVYHQTPQGRKNATWKLTVVGAATGMIPSEIQ